MNGQISYGTWGKTPVKLQHLGGKHVHKIVFALTSQYQLIVKNYNSGPGVLSFESATNCIPSLLPKLPFIQWKNSQILLLRSYLTSQNTPGPDFPLIHAHQTAQYPFFGQQKISQSGKTKPLALGLNQAKGSMVTEQDGQHAFGFMF